jgi:AhpD family alkylhydroperoxidase
MTRFAPHTLESAPSGARPLLDTVVRSKGFLPNLVGVMAEAPPLLEGYLALGSAFAHSSLSGAEQELVSLAVGVANGCGYCVAAHSTIAAGKRVPEETIAALRAGEPLDDARLEALRAFAERLTETRGRPGEDVLEAFLRAGWTRAQALEVVLGVTLNTLTNYNNLLAETPLDAAFTARRWEPAAASAASGSRV